MGQDDHNYEPLEKPSQAVEFGEAEKKLAYRDLR